MSSYFYIQGGMQTVGQKLVQDCPMHPRDISINLPNSGLPSDTDNAFNGGEINLSKIKDTVKALKKDDCLFVALLPDSILYRGLWALTKDVLGFEFLIELVDAKDVWEAHCKEEDLCAVAGVGSPLAFDMKKALGVSTTEAIALADSEGNCDAWSEYRNTDDALQSVLFPATKQFVAQIGHPVYIRMKVVAVPNPDDNVCGDCGLPCIQVAAIGDNLCVQKNMVSMACKNCAADEPCGTGEDCKSCK